jgi:uncharacterized protein
MRSNCNWSKYSARAKFTFLFVLLFALPALATGPSFPLLTGRVVDEAGLLSPATVTDLTDLLAKHEQATGEQVVVVTLNSLQGYTIEDFGYQLGRYWGIGQKDKNTGAILIVVPKEHEVRIEVGYGLEGQLTDAVSRTIIEDDVLPNFRRGDFNTGVLAGATAILKTLRGGSPAVTEPDVSSGAPLTAGDAGSPWDLAALVAIFIVFLVIRSLRRRRYGIYSRIGRSSGFGNFGGFPVGGFSGGGGGFSGGGGSFGGGGASGRW